MMRARLTYVPLEVADQFEDFVRPLFHVLYHTGMRLGEALALEWARDGVTVNGVAPGPTLTPRIEARMELSVPRDGRRRFRGRLKGTDKEEICVELPEGEIRLPFDLIHRAKLVLTDELLAANANKARDGHRSSD